MFAVNVQDHWERIYSTKAPGQLSWYEPHLGTSLALIERVASDPSAAIIDVGGGASTLIDDLIERGYRNVTVLDISQTAIDIARNRLGEASKAVHWLRADVTQAALPERSYNVWHDRAVFHFLTQLEDRRAYVRTVVSVLGPGGHLIMCTFGPNGPEKCSGLDVVRYDARGLLNELGPRFRLLEIRTELHETPFGTMQEFLYCCCRFDSRSALT